MTAVTLERLAFGSYEHHSYRRGLVAGAARRIRAAAGQEKACPVDPVAAALVLGVAVERTPLFGGASGRLRLTPWNATIEVSNLESSQRQRFTVAHELAHFCFLTSSAALPHERGDPVFALTVQKREEQLCQEIAAEFLMPAASLTTHARALEPSFRGLGNLADRFDVSIAAVLTQLQRLRLWSIGDSWWKIASDGQVVPVRGRPVRFVVRRGIRNKSESAQVRRTLQLRLSRGRDLVQSEAGRSGVFSPQLLSRGYGCIGTEVGPLTTWLDTRRNWLRMLALH